MKQVIADVKSCNRTIDAVGHRVVHGGAHTQPEIITPAVVKQLEMLCELAPLHDPSEVEGIKVCLSLMNVPQVAVFDTAFHQTLPPKAYTYAIPRKFANKYHIRRYGFHGISHKYVAHEAAKILGKPLAQLKLITCHLGNGQSICAIDRGKSVDTSMGFTPLEGLVMGSRSGDLDPALVAYLAEKEKIPAARVVNLLNKESGLLGLSGKKDLRDIIASMKSWKGKGSQHARLAFDVMCHRLVKYLGAYYVELGGCDAIVFTAGIGEHAALLRENVLKQLSCIGVALDSSANRKNKAIITKYSSRIKALVIPTNEELMIAREVEHLLKLTRR
ncbi:acetate kinase [Candidatus Woesearchaeota archaeon]|nr:acetate kinase [Candidatus Woesearchaeota archaeon]